MTKVVVISDSHGLHDHIRIPPCDVLIHAGDCTTDIGQKSLREFCIWFERQPAKVAKLLVVGNHDGALEKWNDLARAMIKEYAPSVTYLQDSGVEIGGIKFWGSPYTPEFFSWYHMRKRGSDIRRHWDMIPDDTDVLITHGPAYGILDYVPFDNEHVGCRDLYEAVLRVKPMYHVFGHVHCGYGTHTLVHDDGSKTISINASICDESYNPTRQPFQFEL